MDAGTIARQTISRAKGRRAIKDLPEPRQRFVIAMSEATVLMMKDLNQNSASYLDAIRQWSEGLTPDDQAQLIAYYQWFASAGKAGTAPAISADLDHLWGEIWLTIFKTRHPDHWQELKQLQADDGRLNDATRDMLLQECFNYHDAIGSNP